MRMRTLLAWCLVSTALAVASCGEDAPAPPEVVVLVGQVVECLLDHPLESLEGQVLVAQGMGQFEHGIVHVLAMDAAEGEFPGLGERVKDHLA